MVSKGLAKAATFLLAVTTLTNAFTSQKAFSRGIARSGADVIVAVRTYYCLLLSVVATAIESAEEPGKEAPIIIHPWPDAPIPYI